MQGSGNDFLLLINEEAGLAPEDMPLYAQRLCRRSFGPGADGLIVLETANRPEGTDYHWHFFNADGSRAEMCGNGSRCAARLAYELGLAPRVHHLGTDAGPIKAEVLPDTGEVKVQLTTPADLRLNTVLDLENGYSMTLHSVNTGVPHAVVFAVSAQNVDLKQTGPAIRYHPHFAPAGANVNIVEVQDAASLMVRTYERGVEAETYACGTGAAAAAYIAHHLGYCGPQLEVVTSGGERLRLSLEGNDVFLQGEAQIIYEARVNAPALALPVSEGSPS
jgi:diaminopimelate epimerase